MIIKTPKNSIIKNLRVYDLEESILACQYPMMTETYENMEDVDDDVLAKAFKTAKKLGNTSKGTGHDQYLTGVLVAFDLTLTNKAWVEMQRYNHVYHVSSCSTIHKMAKFDYAINYDENTDPRMIEIMKEILEEYNNNPTKENYLKLLHSNPAGFTLTARLTTNYRALKTVISQRRNHKLPIWREFCEIMIDVLPHFKELTGIDIND